MLRAVIRENSKRELRFSPREQGGAGASKTLRGKDRNYCKHRLAGRGTIISAFRGFF